MLGHYLYSVDSFATVACECVALCTRMAAAQTAQYRWLVTWFYVLSLAAVVSKFGFRPVAVSGPYRLALRYFNVGS